MKCAEKKTNFFSIICGCQSWLQFKKDDLTDQMLFSSHNYKRTGVSRARRRLKVFRLERLGVTVMPSIGVRKFSFLKFKVIKA